MSEACNACKELLTAAWPTKCNAGKLFNDSLPLTSELRLFRSLHTWENVSSQPTVAYKQEDNIFNITEFMIQANKNTGKQTLILHAEKNIPETSCVPLLYCITHPAFHQSLSYLLKRLSHVPCYRKYSMTIMQYNTIFSPHNCHYFWIHLWY